MADTPVSSDERIMAGLAHLCVLLFGWGLIGSIVIWATQKDKSPYVRFQALQSVAYQIAFTLAAIVIFACSMCSTFAFLGAIPFFSNSSPAPSEPGVGDQIAMFVFVFGQIAPFLVGMLGWFVMVAYGLFAAARAFQGRDFRHVLIGWRVERLLAGDSATAVVEG